MELPDWIDQPVTQYPPDPIHDGVGKLITRCVAMEIFLQLTLEQLDASVTEAELRRIGPTACAERISELAHLVPDEDQEDLREEMRVAVAILELRNGVVHGFWDSTLEGQPIPTIRTARADRKTGAAIPTVFNRDYLVGAADRAFKVWGYLQGRPSTWPDVRDI